MAKVPYTGVPESAPSLDTGMGYQSSAGATPDAFGAQVGQAISHFGDIFEKHAVFAQERLNTANATDIATNQILKLGDLDAKQGVLEGKARADAYPDYQDKAMKIVEEGEAAAPNDEVKKQVRSQLKHQTTLSVIGEAKKAATAEKQYMHQTQDAKSTLAKQQAALYADDDSAFEMAKQDGMATVAETLKIEKIDPDSPLAEKMKKDQLTAMWTARLTPMARRDPIRAEKLYNDNNNEITGVVARAAIEERITQGKIQVGSRMDAHKIEQETDAANATPQQLLRNFEGYRGKAYWDVNAWRVGYGSDTVTREDGTIERVNRDTAINRDDAERDLGRRTQETQLQIQNQIGQDAWNKLPARTQASLTSVAYNYGNLPASIAAAAKGGDAAEVAETIFARRFDNQGVNAKRRTQEALFAKSVGAATDTSEGRLAQMLDKVPEAAQKAFPNDEGSRAIYEDTLRQRVTSQFNTSKRVVQDNNIMLQNNILAEINNPQKKVTQIEQLSPNAQEALTRLPPDKQAHMISLINRDVPESDSNSAETRRVMGLAKSLDSEKANEFMEYNPTDAAYGLTRKQINSIAMLQGDRKKQLELGTKMSGPMEEMASQLNDRNIFRSRNDKSANTRYDQFRGAFSDALDQAAQEKKAALTKEERLKIGMKLFDEVVLRPPLFSIMDVGIGGSSAEKYSIPRLPKDTVSAGEAYGKLSSGASFYDPDGNLRRKP